MTEEGKKPLQLPERFLELLGLSPGAFEILFEASFTGAIEDTFPDGKLTDKQEFRLKFAALSMCNLFKIFSKQGETAVFDAVRKMPSENKSKRAVRAKELFDGGMTDFADISEQLKNEFGPYGTSERTVRRYLA
jgi:hypothetical protein